MPPTKRYFLVAFLLTIGLAFVVTQEADYGDYPEYQDYAMDDYGGVQDEYGVPRDTLYHDYAERQHAKDGYVVRVCLWFSGVRLDEHLSNLEGRGHSKYARVTTRKNDGMSAQSILQMYFPLSLFLVLFL